MEGNIAATYGLIFRFLKQQTQYKAAEAVKKAAKAIVVLRDDIEQEGPPLEDIVKEWRTKGNAKRSGDADSSSEDSESSDDSSSDSKDSSSSDTSSEDTSGSESEDDDTSDSDSSGDDGDEGTQAKKLLPKGAERDTSVTLSSVEENAREVAKRAIQIPEKKTTKDKNKASKSDSSDSDSSDSSSSSKGSPSDSSDSSSSSDSSDEDEAKVNKNATRDRKETTEDKGSSSSESSSDSDDESSSEGQQMEDVHIAKKRKALGNVTAVAATVITESQQITRALREKEKPVFKVKERFQRVKVQNLTPELLLNNGYEARGGLVNDYGERAHRDLIVTRGAGFRKEKNKKKRGSYRGGEITMENHSIKFDF